MKYIEYIYQRYIQSDNNKFTPFEAMMINPPGIIGITVKEVVDIIICLLTLQDDSLWG